VWEGGHPTNIAWVWLVGLAKKLASKTGSNASSETLTATAEDSQRTASRKNYVLLSDFKKGRYLCKNQAVLDETLNRTVKMLTS